VSAIILDTNAYIRCLGGSRARQNRDTLDAFETGSVLVTFDEHFDQIPNLRVLRFKPSA
jgi:predicted nucleic acid-binding protein